MWRNWYVAPAGFLLRDFAVFRIGVQAGVGGMGTYTERASPRFKNWFGAARWGVREENEFGWIEA